MFYYIIVIMRFKYSVMRCLANGRCDYKFYCNCFLLSVFVTRQSEHNILL